MGRLSDLGAGGYLVAAVVLNMCIQTFRAPWGGDFVRRSVGFSKTHAGRVAVFWKCAATVGHLTDFFAVNVIPRDTGGEQRADCGTCRFDTVEVELI